VAAAQDTVAVNEDRSNRNPGFRQTAFCFLESGRKKRIHNAHFASSVLRGTHFANDISRNHREGVFVMLHMALVFLVIGIIAALLGFTTIAGASIAIAKLLAGLFLMLFLVFLVIGLIAARRIID
jgi:uncharacterized membrane protein YtjA (UPF0391 family)